jgi:hypothetical protein
MSNNTNDPTGYRMQFSVDQSNFEFAHELAVRYADTLERQADASNFVARLLGNRRLAAIETKLCAVVRQGYAGNVEQAEADIESQLLEPYKPHIKADRRALADWISRDLLSDRMIVTEDTVVW